MLGSSKPSTAWYIADLLYASSRPSHLEPRHPYVLIILNNPITREDILRHLWDNASLRICADGGANRLYDKFAHTPDSHRFIPEYIHGDLDSIRQEVRAYYEERGANVKRIEDQDSTDFMKCIELVDSLEEESHNKLGAHKHDIVGLGGLGGRFDQSIHSIHLLHRMQTKRRIYLISHENVTFLLNEGKNEIYLDQQVEGPTCGILPIGVSSARLTTSGLKWNLQNDITSFGSMVSTSNQLDSDVVTIECDEPLVWTVEIKT
ncbi:uncharacterized protein VTP21DRAFT_7212 [Calcarisporiella thermophila]|uniref:uncharacterized protein n=1 Tax=Calcarisporiella thermophila TaxID=911321 RepID=UPI0037433BF7